MRTSTCIDASRFVFKKKVTYLLWKSPIFCLKGTYLFYKKNVLFLNYLICLLFRVLVLVLPVPFEWRIAGRCGVGAAAYGKLI